MKLDIADDTGKLEVGESGWWSLKEFGRLEMLKVGRFALQVLREARRSDRPTGEDEFLNGLLPSGIRELTLWEPDEDLLEAMRELARSVAGGVASLVETGSRGAAGTELGSVVWWVVRPG